MTTAEIIGLIVAVTSILLLALNAYWIGYYRGAEDADAAMRTEQRLEQWNAARPAANQEPAP